MTNPYSFTEEEYQEFIDKGQVERLFGENAPKNIHMFKTEKNKYIANENVFNLIASFFEFSGADPADIYEYFEENKDAIVEALEMFDTQLLDKNDILDRFSEDI